MSEFYTADPLGVADPYYFGAERDVTPWGLQNCPDDCDCEECRELEEVEG